MATKKTLRVRRSLRELEKDYMAGNKEPLEHLMRAWKGIKELPPDDLKSFFNLGGLHGEPFRGAGWGLNTFWGGYCNHGNVLFPTWHRVYCYKLEQALQSIPGCQDVMLPYWDETDEESLKEGIPWSLTEEYFTLDKKKIPNPLRSFVFPVTITDNVSGDDGLYTKPKGYETVRYPYSGLVGTEKAKKKSEAHNKKYPYHEGVKLLNKNIVGWLNGTVKLPPPVRHLKNGILQSFEQCLDAPNYTVFSNTSSAQQWNQLNDGKKAVMPLEQPHNDIHLAVGGFDVPNQGNFSPVADANGDMGENDTAGLDPIFFFHHCNVDRMFWVWQKRNGYTDGLDIFPNYPGTNTSDSQGATPGVPANAWLDLDTPLSPFTKDDGKTIFTSMDCINIEKQLGFTYSIGSLDDKEKVISQRNAAPAKTVRKLVVSDINRAPIKGSFVISAFATIDGETYHIGSRGVLSRWAVMGCANCQTHLEVKAFFDLDFMTAEKRDAASYHVQITGRQPAAPMLALIEEKSPYKIEVR